MPQHRFDAPIRRAAQFHQLFARHQTIAVDAHEAFGEFMLQRFKRFLNEVFATCVVHDNVFLFGLQIADVFDGDQAQAAAQAGAEMAAALAVDGDGCGVFMARRAAG